MLYEKEFTVTSYFIVIVQIIKEIMIPIVTCDQMCFYKPLTSKRERRRQRQAVALTR